MYPRNTGPRYGAWSQTKCSNLNYLNPQMSEARQVMDRYYHQYKDRLSPMIRSVKTCPDFIMPVEPHHVVETINELPREFTRDLKAIFFIGRLQEAKNLLAVIRLWPLL